MEGFLCFAFQQVKLYRGIFFFFFVEFDFKARSNGMGLKKINEVAHILEKGNG